MSFVPHGTPENSPPVYWWGSTPKRSKSRHGTKETLGPVVPAGLTDLFVQNPPVNWWATFEKCLRHCEDLTLSGCNM